MAVSKSNALDARNGVSGHARSEFLSAFIERHGNQLIRTARRFSDSAADAEDAFQNAIEVLLSKAPDDFDDDRLLAWALTVTRNEALMEHRRRQHASRIAFDEIAERLVDPTLETGEQVAAVEGLGQAREALGRVTPSQLRCLLLRAEGLSYPEIIELTGFSYAKVNRCLSEGRRAFRDQVQRIESGAECLRISSVLSMMADDVASDEDVKDAEAHLKNCLGCRATLRDYRDIPGRAALGAPLGIALAAGDHANRLGTFAEQLRDAAQSAWSSVHDRLAGHAATIQNSGELATAKKAAAVLAASATLVGGGAALHKVTSDDGASDAKSGAGTGAAASNSVASGVPAASRSRKDLKEAIRKEQRQARKARTADVRDAVAGTSTRFRTAPSDGLGSSAGQGDEFDPAPQTVEPAQTGTSDPETGLAP